MAEGHGIGFGEAARAWARVAALSFGGPAGQIAVMHRIIVEEKRWVGEQRFLHALNFCMVLPGPEAQQLAIYLGWLMHGTGGGLTAGLLFILPGFVTIMALSFVYVAFGETGLVAGLFFGLKAAVLAVVLRAFARLGGRMLRTGAARAIAGGAFLAIFLFRVPFPLIIVMAGALGYLGWRAGWPGFGASAGEAAAGEVSDAESALGEGMPDHARRGAGRVAAALAVLWLAPVLILVLALGRENVFAQLAMFFSKLAVVTFGGAYAVLAYVAQEAVGRYGWLLPGEMLDGLGLAETTPGPLIMVVQFVGFLAAFRAPGALDPWVAAALGAVVVVWVTFVPSFLWIFLGAPYVERLRGNAAVGAALSGITAAVVGVILNLALWFGLHVIFTELRPWSGFGIHLDVPVPASLDLAALILSLGAILAIFRLRASMGAVMAGCAALGLLWTALG